MLAVALILYVLSQNINHLYLISGEETASITPGFGSKESWMILFPP